MKINRHLTLITLTIIIVLAFSIAAPVYGQSTPSVTQEWTQDAHDAQRTGYTPEQPLEGWTFLWSWNGPDANGGTGGHIYNASDEARTVTGGSYLYAPAGSRGLYALSKTNGSQGWNVTAATFNATPAYDPATGYVYAGGANGTLYKIDSRNGSIAGTYSAGNALNKSVLLVGTFAYVVTDNGQLHKVNTTNMTRAWMYAGNAAIATPPSYSATRDTIVYATNDLFIHAVNNSNGSSKWRVKPTELSPGFPNEMDGMWPVIAEQHGVVFVRMRLDHNAGLWGGPGPGGMYPTTNAATRQYLEDSDWLQNLFALSLDDGDTAFIPAVGYGGVEDIAGNMSYLDLGPVPVIKILPNGKEVAYMMFRSGQGNPPDGRWDSHFGEMVLDDTTIPGMVAGDLRFIDTRDYSVKITDEQVPFTLAGDTVFRAHWGASENFRITNRANNLGLTFTSPITTQKHPTVIRRIQSCNNFNPSTHWTTCGLGLANETRSWAGPGFWVYWNVNDPPTPITGAYSDGLRPRYTYASAGLIIVEGNGGDIFVLKHSGTPLTGPAPATPVPATGTTAAPPTNTAVALTPTRTPTNTGVPPTATRTPTPTRTPTVGPVTPTQTPPGSGNSTPQVTTLSTSAPLIGRYMKFELTFQINKTFPAGSFLPYYYYDPADPVGINGITIDAHFRSPSGREIVAPAFYFQDYVRTRGVDPIRQMGGDNEIMTPTNNFMWKVRFAPEETGNYTYYLTILDRNGTSRYPTSGTLQVQSVPSTSKGFIRVSPRDSRFMEYSNGQSYIPISSGHQWWTGTLRSYDYEATFTQFKTNGINLVRIWDQNDGFNLTVEGRYDSYGPGDGNPEQAGIDIDSIPKGTQMNQRGNYEEDVIIQSAEANGVYIQLTAKGDPYWIWDSSINDGTADSWMDPARVRNWQRNFRYRVARWGYSTSVLAWEHWNELGHVPTNSDIYQFYQVYGQYQQQTDPYRHLRTTSQGSQAYSPGLWSSSAFDIANYHDYMMTSRYSADLAYDAANFVYRFAQCVRGANPGTCGLGLGDGSQWSGPPKPFIWGELDSATSNWDANPRPKATHDMRWAGLFSPLGTSPIDWNLAYQSASFVTTKHQEAKIASDFFAGLDYAGKNFTYLSTSDVRLSSVVVNTSSNQLRVLAMRAASNNEAYAWVQNKGHANWNNDTVPAPLSATFTLPGMAAGNYRVEIWDTYTGQKTDGGVVTANNGNLTISVSGLSKDVAIKITSTTQTVPTATVAATTPAPSLTPTRTPSPTFTSTPVTPTATFTNTPITPTATFTRTPVTPTATFTRTPVTPTATFTNTPITPTATFTSTPVTPTATFTATPVTPTATFTSTPVTPTATFTNTPVMPTATFTNTPVTPPATPTGDTPGISVSVSPAAANPGETVAVSLNMNDVTNIYGLEVTCQVDPTVLAGGTHTGGNAFNDTNSFTVDAGFQPDGKWHIAATRLLPNPAITGDDLAFILNYVVMSAGSTPVDCTVLAVDVNGYDVAVQVVDGIYTSASQPGVTPTVDSALTLTPSSTPVTPTATPTVEIVTAVPGGKSIISGVVNYPGMTDHSGVTVGLLDANNTPLVQVVTNGNGAYRFTDVPVGAYVLQLSAPHALLMQGIVLVTADGSTVDLGTIILPVGDTDDNGIIDLNDASLVGVNFGVDGSLVPNADLNRDADIDIRDLVLVGKNFGLTEPITVEGIESDQAGG